jgi:hypothetical protein
MGWVGKLPSKHLRASMQLMLEFCHQCRHGGSLMQQHSDRIGIDARIGAALLLQPQLLAR